MKVFTTINPNGNFDAQNEAMLSWSSKFDVYSINTKEEVEKIKDLYTYINFIETDNTFNYKNKKLIKLNALLESIKNTNTDVACIVNSDIILNTKSNNLTSKINLQDSIIIGTRYEIDGENIYPFNNGYDIFIFNTKHIDLLKNNNYVIGMPWWDFWIPLISIKAGLKVYHIKNKVIYHRTHEVNYDGNVWIQFGEYLYKDIMVNLLNNPLFGSVYNFCTAVKTYIESKQINIKIK